MSWNGYFASSLSVNGSDISGILAITNVNDSYGVCPVTSLKSCVQWKSGDGSAESPYEIAENGGC
ncbi:MAG: hypothetical protein MR779_03535 [Tenericutes bacterium]|nr:hypothetical protein [Mycoplasmatota bacterium]